MSADHPAHNPPAGRFLPHQSRPYATVADSESTNSSSAQPIPSPMDWQLAPPAVASPEPQTQLQPAAERPLWISADTVVDGGHPQGSLEFVKGHLDTPERQDAFIDLLKPLFSLKKSALDSAAFAVDPMGVKELRQKTAHTMHTLARPFIDRKAKSGAWNVDYSLAPARIEAEVGNGFGKRFHALLGTLNSTFSNNERDADDVGIHTVSKKNRWAYKDYYLADFLEASVEKFPDGRDPDDGKEYSFRDRTEEALFDEPTLRPTLERLVEELAEGYLAFNLDKHAGVEMKDPKNGWWAKNGLNFEGLFAAIPWLAGTKSFETFSSRIVSIGGLVRAIQSRALSLVNQKRANAESRTSVSELKFLAGITSRPVPEQHILDFSVFTKNLKSTTLHNSVKPFVSPLSEFVPSDIKFGGQDWSSFSNLTPQSYGPGLCAAVDLDVTQALQPEFDRLLDASGLSQADMEQACSDAQDYLIEHDHANTRSTGDASTRGILLTENFYYQRVQSLSTGKRRDELAESFAESIKTAKRDFQPSDPRQAYLDTCSKLKLKKVDIALTIAKMKATLEKDNTAIIKNPDFLIQVGKLLLSSNALFSVNESDFSIAAGVANFSRAKARLNFHKTALGTSYVPLLRFLFASALASLLGKNLNILSIYVDSSADNIWRACETFDGQNDIESIAKDNRGMILRFGIESTKERGTDISRIARDLDIPSIDPAWYLHLGKEQQGVCFMAAEACGRMLYYDPYEKMEGTIKRDGQKVSVGVLERRSSDATKLGDPSPNWVHYPCPYTYFTRQYNATIAHYISRFAYLYHVTDRPGRGKPRMGQMGRALATWEVNIDQTGGEEEAEDEKGNVKEGKESSDEEMDEDGEEGSNDDEDGEGGEGFIDGDDGELEYED